MSLQAYFNEFSEGHWADPDEKVCGCRGSGYALSDVDTWHKCPYHPATRHPEDDYYDDDPVVNADSDELAITAEDMEAAETRLAVRAPVALTDDDIPF
jgi:hypothetical protein